VPTRSGIGYPAPPPLPANVTFRHFQHFAFKIKDFTQLFVTVLITVLVTFAWSSLSGSGPDDIGPDDIVHDECLPVLRMREAREPECRQAFEATRESLDGLMTKTRSGFTVQNFDYRVWHASDAAYFVFREHWFASREGANRP